MASTPNQLSTTLSWLSPLNYAIDRLMSADDLFAERVRELNGKTVLLHIDGLDLRIYASFHTTGVSLDQIKPSEIDKVDVTLRGKVKDFIALAKNQRAGQSMSAGQVEIQGDLHTAQRVQDLMRDVDIDLEEIIARATNDAFAYGLGSFARRSISGVRKGLQALEQDVGAYLQYEKQLTPSSQELSAFADEVDDLALAVERLESRINRLRDT